MAFPVVHAPVQGLGGLFLDYLGWAAEDGQPRLRPDLERLFQDAPTRDELADWRSFIARVAGPV